MGPSVKLMATLHRPKVDDHEHHIPFTRKTGDGHADWVEFGSMPARELFYEWIPELGEQFVSDSYAGTNGMRVPARFDDKGRRHDLISPSSDYLARSHRNRDNVHTLSACFADLDIYNVGMSFDEARIELLKLKIAGLIPEPSIIASSGRGMYVYWMLRDRDDDLYPPRSSGKLIARWSRIQDAIDKGLAHLGSDSQVAKNVAGVLRIPGSINSKSGTRVKWTINGEGERPYLYTVDGLTDAFGVSLPSRRTSRVSGTIDPERSAKARQGAIGRWGKAYRQFDGLREYRGGFSKGCRNRAVYLYALIVTQLRNSLRSNGGSVTDPPILKAIHTWTDDDIRRELSAVIGDMRDPFTKAEARERLYNCDPTRLELPKRPNRCTIGDWLKITPEEADFLSEHFGTKDNPQTWAPSKEHREDEPEEEAKETRNERMKRRRRLIRAFILNASQQKAKFPTLRELNEHLRPFNADVKDLSALTRDMEDMGIENPRSKKGRATKKKLALPFKDSQPPSTP